MIKVILGCGTKKDAKDFPKLMKTDDGLIVLFLNEGGGVVMRESCSTSRKSGEYSTGWIMRNFTDYNKPITIQNE